MADFFGDGGDLDFSDPNDPLVIDIVGGNDTPSNDTSGDTSAPVFGNDGGPGVDVGADPGGGTGDSDWTQTAGGQWRNRTTGELFDPSKNTFTMPGGTPKPTSGSPSSGGSTGGGTTVNNNTGGTSTFGGGSSPQGIAAALAAIYAANRLNNAAGDYTTMGEKYAGQLDPYGSYRKAAADKLAALQADPSSIQNTPGYKFALQEGMGSVANRDNQRFGVGATSTNPDLMRFAQGLASKTYNDTIKQYSDQAGVGIGPQSAAAILGQGMQGNINAKLGAASALASIPGTLTNPTFSSSGASGPSLWDQFTKMFGGGLNPNDVKLPTVTGDNTGGNQDTGTNQSSFNNTPDNQYIPPGGGA